MNQPLTTVPTAPPADVLEALKQSTGKGLSTDQRDNLVPLVYLLQKLSPQIEERDPRFIEGARPGDIWLRGAPSPYEIIKGDEGMLFQPVLIYGDWGEWIVRERGGGLVARYPIKEKPEERDLCPVEDAKKQIDPGNRNKVKFVRPNGNEIVFTKNHVGLVLTPDKQAWPYIIPMTSSGHSVSRGWMTDMNRKTFNNQRTDAWFQVWRIKSRLRTNAQGTWYTWLPTDGAFVWDIVGNENALMAIERGKALYNAFATGEKQAAAADQNIDDGGDDEAEKPF
jgi:hypothetical protein